MEIYNTDHLALYKVEILFYIAMRVEEIAKALKDPNNNAVELLSFSDYIKSHSLGSMKKDYPDITMDDLTNHSKKIIGL